MTELSRERYAALYGPTTGDRVRLADTDLFIEVTDDLSMGAAGAGDEAVFGGGKVIRESMGQARTTRADGAADLVITGAVILDHWGVIKADVGVRDGRIAAVGKAGNPDTMDGVDIVIGPSTEVLAGNGKILTAGAVDSHVHLICPQLLDEAIGSGVTTIVGGRHRTRRGHQGHHRHRHLVPRPHARVPRRLPAQLRPPRQGQHGQHRGAGRAAQGRRLRLQAARGLGHHPGRHRRLPERGRRLRRAGHDPHRHAERGRLPRIDAQGHR
ncbi:hypothetical protein GCM10020001_073040 [Nonomuraea salmonea]